MAAAVHLEPEARGFAEATANPPFLFELGPVKGRQVVDQLQSAVGAQAAVVFPNYSLSPEAKYPTAIEQSCATVKWVAEHGREHGLDATRLTVASGSVGGNMAFAVTLMARPGS